MSKSELLRIHSCRPFLRVRGLTRRRSLERFSAPNVRLELARELMSTPADLVVCSCPYIRPTSLGACALRIPGPGREVAYRLGALSVEMGGNKSRRGRAAHVVNACAVRLTRLSQLYLAGPIERPRRTDTAKRCRDGAVCWSLPFDSTGRPSRLSDSSDEIRGHPKPGRSFLDSTRAEGVCGLLADGDHYRDTIGGTPVNR